MLALPAGNYTITVSGSGDDTGGYQFVLQDFAAATALTPGTPVSEQYLLDLEREAFLSLCGEKKTRERIAFTLKSGRPLRN